VREREGRDHRIDGGREGERKKGLGLACARVCVCAHNKRVLFTFPGPPVSCEKAPTSSTTLHWHTVFCLSLNGCIYDVCVCEYIKYNTLFPLLGAAEIAHRQPTHTHAYIIILQTVLAHQHKSTRFNYLSTLFLLRLSTQ